MDIEIESEWRMTAFLSQFLVDVGGARHLGYSGIVSAS